MTSEAATGGVLWKKVFLKVSQISQENSCVDHVLFSCEYCEILKNTYFEEHMRTTASATWNLDVLPWKVKISLRIKYTEEAVLWRKYSCFWKMATQKQSFIFVNNKFYENVWILQGKHAWWTLLLAWNLTLVRKDFVMEVFVEIFQNFQNSSFLETSTNTRS